MNKYKLTKETKVLGGITLYRIIAVSDFANVKAGELGGFIEKENNLSQDGSSWVFHNARVYGDAQVCGDAWVYGCTQIFWISNIGSRSRTTTFFLCEDKKIRAKCGCFYGDLDEFSSRVQATHGGNRYGETYRLAIEMAMSQIVIPEGDFE